MSLFPKLICTYNEFPIKIPAELANGTVELILKPM